MVFKRPAARRDLVGHYVYLAENGREDAANRFMSNAEASFDDLAQHRAMGSPMTLRRPELAELRKWRVKEFEDFLIFYLPRRDGVCIVRVLHATQDW